MRMNHVRALLLFSVLSPCLLSQETTPPTPSGVVGPTPAQAGHGATPPAAPDKADTEVDKKVDAIQKQVSDINASLNEQSKASDFQLVLGIGSLIGAPDVSDYTNQSNTLASTSLGSATPQYLVGVSLRTHIPNFRFFRHSENSEAVEVPNANGKRSKAKPRVMSYSDCYPRPSKVTPAATVDTYVPSECQVWRQRPFAGFVSLKFAPNSSETLSGYVLGGSYSIGKYLDVLIGFALTPANEASPGLRSAASLYVKAQQALGNDLNFDPVAMSKGAKNAFDGFSLADSSGKLIYTGTPLETHYRGGVVFGIAIPISFASVFAPGQK